MSKLKIGFIGTGNRAKQPGHMGYAMAYQHAEAYQDLESCCLLYTSPSPRDRQKSRMPSSA